MHTLVAIAKALNRPVLFLHGLQTRFELPAGKGAIYSDAYLAFLRTIVYLRMLNISEEVLLKLFSRIRAEVIDEIPLQRDASRWAARLNL